MVELQDATESMQPSRILIVILINLGVCDTSWLVLVQP
eukprot:COSAG02_NODE_5336_length_4426_cov_2.244973_5_plen_38_part_00